MKKSTLRNILCTALLSIMLIGCGGDKDYRNMLPDDSFMIMSMNMKSLREKANASDSFLHKFIRQRIEANPEMSDVDRDYLLSIISDPSQTGIDDASDCFMFMNMEEGAKYEVGMLFRIKDLGKFENLINFGIQKGMPEKRTEKGFTLVTEGNGAMMLAYNTEGAMIFISKGGYKQNIARVTELFNQKKKRSLIANKEILKTLDTHNDICMMMSLANLPSDMLKEVESNPIFELSKKAILIYPVNFEKGKIVSEGKVYFADSKSEKEYFDLNYMVKQNGNLVKFIPQNSIFTIGMNGKTVIKIYEQLTKIPMYGQIVNSMPQIKTILDAIEGDVIISFNKMDASGKTPEATLVAEIKDPAAIQNMMGILAAMPVKQTAPYQYEASMPDFPNFSFGLQGNMLYITTDPIAASAIKGANIASIEPRFGKLFKDSYSTVAIDLMSLHSMLEAMLANRTVSQRMADMLPMIKIFDTWEMSTVSRTEVSMIANMTDKENNALDTIYHTVEFMVTPFIKMAMSSSDTSLEQVFELEQVTE